MSILIERLIVPKGFSKGVGPLWITVNQIPVKMKERL